MLARLARILGLCALAAPADAQEPPIPADTEVQQTASGLEYCFLARGNGAAARPERQQVVRVHYTGWLPDGTVFDSSRRRGRAYAFEVGGGVIAGWNEGIRLMRPGDRVKLTVPPQLAYGATGRPPIAPDATLVFDLELLDVLVLQPLDPERVSISDTSLRYQILREGSGPACTDEDVVEFEYVVYNEQGVLADTSIIRDKPHKYMVGDLPFGVLREGVKLLREGGRARFQAPPELAFGAQGKGPIAPNTVTHWDLEIVEVLQVPRFAMPAENEWRTTASGLKYVVLEEGRGEAPQRYDQVACHYMGWLADGTYFDGSYAAEEPYSFVVGGRVIEGWSEGVQLMKPGAVYRFLVPPHLAYGERGNPPIPPNAELLFHIELLPGE